MSKRTIPLCLVASLFALTPASALHAAELSSGEVAARRGLIEGAQSAREAGDHTRALDLATRAGELKMSVSLRRFIAEEQLAVGHFASALGSAELCVREARAEAAQDEHGKACEAVVVAAKPRVASLVIQPKLSVPGLRVTVAGQAVPAALFGQRYLVDPGEVVVEAGAEGYEPFRVTVAPQAGAELQVVVDPKPKPKEKSPVKKEGGFVLSPLLPIGAGVAVAGGAVALGFGVSGQLALADYEDRCTVPGAPRSCAAEQTELQSDLDGRAIAFDVALSLAGAGLVVGTIGIFLSGPSEEQKAAMWQGKILF